METVAGTAVAMVGTTVGTVVTVAGLAMIGKLVAGQAAAKRAGLFWHSPPSLTLLPPRTLSTTAQVIL